LVAQRWIFDDNYSPRLAIAATRCESRIVKNVMYDLIVNNLVGETTNGTRGSDAVAKFHINDLRSSSDGSVGACDFGPHDVEC
jgi:hypothetical protein